MPSGPELALALGLMQSHAMGERTPAPTVSGSVAGGPVEGRVTYDSSDKTDQGGWNLRMALRAAVKDRLLAGVDYSHRDGGDWTKNTLWGTGGIKAGPVEVVGRYPLWADSAVAKNNKVVSMLGRVTGDHPLNDHMALRTTIEPGVHRFTQGTDRRTGLSLDSSLGLAWK